MPPRSTAPLLVALLLGTAHAASITPDNLRRAPLCFSSTQVQIDPRLEADVPGLTDTLTQRVTNRVTAYRLPIRSACTPADVRLWVQVDAVKLTSGARAYNTTLNVYANTPGFAQVVTVYNLGVYGVTPDQGTALIDYLWSSTSPMIDQFAADWAKANP